MPNFLLPVFYNIAGRLYIAIGMLFTAMVVTNLLALGYSGGVAAGARAVAVNSIDNLRAADDFDELLDRHRRALTAAIEAHDGTAGQEALAALSGLEQEFASNPAPSDAVEAPSTVMAAKLRTDAAKLKAASRMTLDAKAAGDERASAEAFNAYVDIVNVVEEDVAAWKAQMRDATAAELATMNAGAAAMRTLSLAGTAAAILIGLAAVLISRGVLMRLRQLTASMLSLAAGNIETIVPFRRGRDEVSRLADALEVFRDQAQRAMSSEMNLRAAFENMAEGILMLSPDRRIVLHNQRFATMVGLNGFDLAGTSYDAAITYLIDTQNWPVEMIDHLTERLDAIATQQSILTFDIDLPGRCYSLNGVVMPNANLLLSIEDVSERRAAADRIFHLAHHDTLTGLPNRASFQERLGEAVEDAVCTHGIGVTLLLCDLDHFKEVNDTYGHPTGDELLREVARRMRETMRKTDILARLGGDEFAIIHLNGPDPREAHVLAERLVAALTVPFEIHDNKMSIGVSIGIACAPVNARSAVDLMKQADLALYAAKHGGRNMHMVYDASMAEKLEERRSIEAEIRTALIADGFHLHYQPQLDLETRRIIGFEALARWDHPQRGAIPPAVFIPIAEESDLIVDLGAWALRKACSDAAAWGGDTTIAVNVSPHQFRKPGFIEVVRAALDDSGLAPERLEIEITETAMLNDGEKMLALLQTLRAMRVRLSVDDFGTGYSALNYLQRFPFDKIKIDQSFVRDLGNKGESDAIVRAVAALGTNLGIRILAEGVETEHQAMVVLDADCREGQGYLFSHPVPAVMVHRMLAEQDELSRPDARRLETMMVEPVVGLVP